MRGETPSANALILDVLDYLAHVEKLNIKPAYSIPDESPCVAFEHALRELPELQYDLQSDGDDLWLHVPRLQEIAAPDPDDALKPWITLPKNPEKSPVLKSEIVIVDEQGKTVHECLDEHPEIQALFDWYVENQWMPWASTEQPRRKTIDFYRKLFSLQQSIELDGAGTALELVWGIGCAVWKKQGAKKTVKYPLLLQACEVSLNGETHALEIRPRQVNPKLELDCYEEMEIPGVKTFSAFWRSTLESGETQVNPFDAATYEHILKAAVAHLDASGRYDENAGKMALPVADDRLHIVNTWVIFGRKRSAGAVLEDIARLRENIKAADTLPGMIRSFVEHAGSEVKVQPEQPYRGLSSSDFRDGAMELYFPLAYNDEQVAIIQKLHANDGVVVQGPPGTGKTHTIANVICHYLAQGKRILVTAKGETALAVLRDKIPEEVRQLSVALLINERDGNKQFERSIQTISSKVQSINPKQMEVRIAASEEKLNKLHAQIAHVDRTVCDAAARHMRNDYPFQGRKISLGDMAKMVLRQAEMHQWFDDEPPQIKDGILPFDDADINALRQARMRVQEDLRYLADTLPPPENFPEWPELLELHRALVRTGEIETSLSRGEILPLEDSSEDAFENVREFLEFIDRRMELKGKLSAANLPWLEPLCKHLEGMYQQDVKLHDVLDAVLGDVRTLKEQRREFLAHALVVPVDAELDGDFMAAVVRLGAGKRAFSLPFGKRETRNVISAITVTGFPPKSADQWQLVQKYLGWRIEVRALLARWNGLLEEFALPQSYPEVDNGFRQVSQWEPHIENASLFALCYDDVELHSRIRTVFGKPIADQWQDDGDGCLADIHSSLRAHLDKNSLLYAKKRLDELLRKLFGYRGKIVDHIRSFLNESLPRTDADESVLGGEWETLRAELCRLTALRPAFDEITRVTDAINSAGAPKWAERLRIQPATADLDTLTPVSWHEAWEWRQAVMFLDQIDVHHKMRHQLDTRAALSKKLASTYRTLVAEKAWLGVCKNSSPAHRQSLQGYLNAVQAMGKGTGKHAARHRQAARKAMSRAHQAVPCWILPHWRVSEDIPPDIGQFDLVIIDEASQSEIGALLALLRGQKVLVVGDHLQVSPSTIGTSAAQINALERRFLDHLPHGTNMTPDKSIYDFARVVFAGNSVMLKEHSRSVPAIIEFSNREFYQGEIKPLRLPGKNERLDPPLVDVFVKGGVRGDGKSKDVNTAEARAIIDEIKRILATPEFAGRTIGIVSLLSTATAHMKYLTERILHEISQKEMIDRQIHVGTPTEFQGRERDIMMLSMVIDADGRGAADKADIRQRFNVAMSRARDRMYLFRSVRATDVSENSWHGKVISHFKQPFKHDAKKLESLRERCESGFEVEMFDELVKRGYRVEPQVSSGGYRIDFVVEGSQGRRLAIECDGDRFHGPEQWPADMARQRVLERAGWTFWRCFASDFVRHREEVLDDLVQNLNSLGIEPLGADSVDNTVWVTYREVDPYGVDESEDMPEVVDV